MLKYIPSSRLLFYRLFCPLSKQKPLNKAANTLCNYRGFFNPINAFERLSKKALRFEAIHTHCESKFLGDRIPPCKSSPSHISKQFALLKAFMGWAQKKGYHSNLVYKSFSYREEPATKVALTEPEYQALQRLDLSGKQRLARVRDMFLFCCETSLRYSDLQNLKPINISSVSIRGDAVSCLKLSMIKTRGAITSPLSELALALLEKYQSPTRSTCFPVISGQKMNDYLKEICKQAGIDTAVQMVRRVGNQRIEEEKQKYEMVSMHTARRTFITLRVQRGWTDQQIMVYTGHKSSKEIQTYRDKSEVSLVETALGAPRVG